MMGDGRAADRQFDGDFDRLRLVLPDERFPFIDSFGGSRDVHPQPKCLHVAFRHVYLFLERLPVGIGSALVETLKGRSRDTFPSSSALQRESSFLRSPPKGR